MDQVHVIRYQVLVEGRSQRRAARRHGVLGGATYSVPSRWKSLEIHAFVGASDIVFSCRDAEYRCDLVRPGQRLVR